MGLSLPACRRSRSTVSSALASEAASHTLDRRVSGCARRALVRLVGAHGSGRSGNGARDSRAITSCGVRYPRGASTGSDRTSWLPERSGSGMSTTRPRKQLSRQPDRTVSSGRMCTLFNRRAVQTKISIMVCGSRALSIEACGHSRRSAFGTGVAFRLEAEAKASSGATTAANDASLLHDG